MSVYCDVFPLIKKKMIIIQFTRNTPAFAKPQ